MTITATDNKFRYLGNGVTDTFSFPARVYSVNDLIVEIITRADDTLEEILTITTHYSVTLNNDGTADVQVVSGKIPSNTQDIQLRRALTKVQTLELPTGTTFPAKSVENQLDRAVSLIQDMQEQVDRAMKLPPQSSITSISLEETPIAGRALKWNGTGDGLINSDYDPDTQVASATTQAGIATTQAGIATTQAGIATTQAGIATTQAGLAETAKQEILDSQVKYQFSTSVTMADPSTGYLRFNNATPASVTAIAIDDQTAQTGNPNIAAYIATWDDTNGTVKGKVRIVKEGAPTVFAIYNITGLSDNSGWTELAVTYVDGAGTISNNDNIYISFCPNGNDGTSFSKTDITGQPSATIAATDKIVFSDTSDSGNLKSDTVTGIANVVVGATRTYTGAQKASQTSLTSSSASIAIDFALNNDFTHTFTENTTLANPSNIVVGQSGAIFFTQHASSPKTLAFGSYWDFAGGTAPAVTATNSARDTLFYHVRSTTQIEASLVKNWS